jgi:oligopeptide/dipeptide ABC transporter ATP-binding protein
MHASFEDRPGAPDRIFAALDDDEYERHVAAWARALDAAGAAQADILHLHHLTPLNAAAAIVAPGVPVVGHLHGTELLRLEAIAEGRAWPHGDVWAERLRTWAAACERLIVAPGNARRAVELLDLVGIPDAAERSRAVPHEVSGGMRQRVMIAMAIANDPDVIIADEPTTALDVTVQAQILETLREVQAHTGAALILITHDLGVVANMAGEVMVMYAGRPVERGTVDDIYDRPRMPYTVGLLGSLPRLDTDSQERLTPITGSPPSLLNLPAGCPFQPRCPMARDRCREEEPPLYATDGYDHLAACHFWEELQGDVRAADVFATTSVDDIAEVDLLEGGA